MQLIFQLELDLGWTHILWRRVPRQVKTKKANSWKNTRSFLMGCFLYGALLSLGGTSDSVNSHVEDSEQSLPEIVNKQGMWGKKIYDLMHGRYERPNIFSECYNLAFTQHKKNKDIPEGGAKATLFLLPYHSLASDILLVKADLEEEEEEHVDLRLNNYASSCSEEYIHFNQRAFISTFLPMLVFSSETKCLVNPKIVDYLGTPEAVFLGPDENMHSDTIEWIANASVQAGYTIGSAFISGKVEAGINHKQYGVTSAGCFTFLRVLLEKLELTDKPFTLKMTGGPDGDVAGNLLRLLHEKMGSIAKVVALTDVSGTIYDPEGIDLRETAQLFASEQPIHKYDPKLLHKGGFLLCLNVTRARSSVAYETLCYKKIRPEVGLPAEEVWLSNNTARHIFLTNVHSTKADIFAPCGGRPRSLNADNVQEFFQEGRPTAQGIIEGANLYITDEARHVLEDNGVLIVKDSSANKGGVISSSFEILAGIALSREQFLSVKSDLAKEILLRIEADAYNEAKCLFAGAKYRQIGSGLSRLTQVSDLISAHIIKYKYDILRFLQNIDLADNTYMFHESLSQAFVEYLPKCLSSQFLDQIMQRVPDNHKKAIMAASLACKLVYSRGHKWQPTVIDSLPCLLLPNMEHCLLVRDQDQ
ncbi:glutamate dehydrogenase, mitochondrial [Pelomyxa schiedti]|nr:glutamate dehydrogenase, mitochondrial [Pelomyxa schiedti]